MISEPWVAYIVFEGLIFTLLTKICRSVADKIERPCRLGGCYQKLGSAREKKSGQGPEAMMMTPCRYIYLNFLLWRRHVVFLSHPPRPRGSFTFPHFHCFLMGTSYFLCTGGKTQGLGCISVVICKKQNTIVTYTFHNIIFWSIKIWNFFKNHYTVVTHF